MPPRTPRPPLFPTPYRHQMFLLVAVHRFRKLKRRMNRLTAEAEAFRETRDTAFSVRILRAWRADARGRGGLRKKIVGMARRRDKRVSQQVSGHPQAAYSRGESIHGVLCRYVDVEETGRNTVT